MINLRKKIEKRKAGKVVTLPDSRVIIRDQLLIKDVIDLDSHMPRTCKVHFGDPNKLHLFELTVSPVDGYWQGGQFKFNIDVPEDYNNFPPRVKCTTKIWHPNITERGEVCLSILRTESLDSMGWTPTRTLKDVIWGLNSLFTDLLNFEDPLNVEAAKEYEKDKASFINKVKYYVQQYAYTVTLPRNSHPTWW